MVLSDAQRRFIERARRAILATQAPDGRPRPMPVCFAVGLVGADDVPIYTPIDEKPKRSADPLALARVRDILARPRVAMLFDRWDEDWSRLGWLRAEGIATVLMPGAATADECSRAIALLRARYPQYAAQDLESRPMLRVGVTGVISWGAIDEW